MLAAPERWKLCPRLRTHHLPVSIAIPRVLLLTFFTAINYLETFPLRRFWLRSPGWGPTPDVLCGLLGGADGAGLWTTWWVPWIWRVPVLYLTQKRLCLKKHLGGAPSINCGLKSKLGKDKYGKGWGWATQPSNSCKLIKMLAGPKLLFKCYTQGCFFKKDNKIGRTEGS